MLLELLTQIITQTLTRTRNVTQTLTRTLTRIQCLVTQDARDETNNREILNWDPPALL